VARSRSLGSAWACCPRKRERIGRPCAAFILTGVARMLAHNGENERAALVLGAAAAMQEKVGMLPQGPRAEVLRNVIDVLGNAPGEVELQRLRTEGRAMSLEEVVALATQATN
jgi:hypothetical protein